MIKIVLVDDHKIVRDGVHALLENESDFTVIGEASDGRKAVELAEQLKPDIVVMDISMQYLNGIEASERIKKEHPEIKIIILSMHIAQNYVIQAFKSGVSGYVLKDASHADLVKAIRTVHVGRQYVCTEVSDILIDAIHVGAKGIKAGEVPLTSREKEVLQLIAEGKTVKQIAADLFISPKTVSSHRANIMEKLNIKNLPQLTKYAISIGLTTPELNK